MWQAVGRLSVAAIIAISVVAAVIVGTLGLFGTAIVFGPEALVALAGAASVYFFEKARNGGGVK